VKKWSSCTILGYLDVDLAVLYFDVESWEGCKIAEGSAVGRLAILGKEAAVAGAVEMAIRITPLDQAAHMRAGCGNGNNRLQAGILFPIVTVIAYHVSNHHL
jgi:hypothetical protein